MAERFRFSERALKSKKCPESQDRIEVYDDNPERPNFGMRISHKGKKNFFFTYRSNGNLRRMKLGNGDFPKEVTFKDAIAAYHEARQAVQEGRDPQEEKLVAKAAKRDSDEKRKNQLSVGDLSRRYIELEAKPKRKTWKEAQRHLDTWVLPYLKDRFLGASPNRVG